MHPIKYLFPGLLLVAFLSIIACLKFGGWAQIKDFRANTLLGAAVELLEKDRPKEALIKLRSAKELSPYSERVNRMLAEVLQRANNPEALFHWEGLAGREEATAADVIGYIECLLQFAQHDVAKEAIAKHTRMLSSQQKRELLATYYRQVGDAQSLETLALQQLKKGDDSEGLLDLLRVELQRADPADELSYELLTLLYEKLEKKDKEMLAIARRMILEHQKSALPLKEQVARDLLSSDYADFNDKVQALAKLVALQSANASELTQWESLVTDADTLPVERQILLFEVLYKNGFNEAILKHLPWESAQNSSRLFLIRQNALGSLGRWDLTLEELQAENNPPLQDIFRYVYLARAAHETNKPGAAIDYWSRALESTAHDERLLGYTADYALEAGMNDLAKRSFERMILNSNLARVGYAGLVTLQHQQKDYPATLATLLEAQEVLPNEETITADIAFYRLLLERDMDLAYPVADSLFQQSPNMLAYRVIYALAQIRKNKPQQAAEVLDIPELDWTEHYPEWAWVKATALKLSGQQQRAAALHRKLLTSQQPIPEALKALYNDSKGAQSLLP